MLDYGTDLSTFSSVGVGLDPTFEIISGPRAPLERVARRYMTPKGFFEDYPDYGYDLRANMGRKLAPIVRQRISYEMKIEGEREETVRLIKIDNWTDMGGGRWKIPVGVELVKSGTFRLVLAASKVTVEILSTGKA